MLFSLVEALFVLIKELNLLIKQSLSKFGRLLDTQTGFCDECLKLGSVIRVAFRSTHDCSLQTAKIGVKHDINIFVVQGLGVLRVGHPLLGLCDDDFGLLHALMFPAHDVVVYFARRVVLDRLLGGTLLMTWASAQKRGLMKIPFRALLGYGGALACELKR